MISPSWRGACGCELQMGGSDQWGNIVAGVELGRRSDGQTLFGLTTPLLTTASGAKMGKSAQGAVWLNAERLSPYDYWQFWRNTEDADVGRFLRLYHRIAARRDRAARKSRRRRDQRGEKGAGDRGDRARAWARGGRSRRRDRARGVRGPARSAATLPQIAVPRDALERGMPAFELFARAGLAASNSEARRLIKGGGARINDKLVSGETTPVSLADLDAAGSHQVQRRPQAPRAGAAGVAAPEAPMKMSRRRDHDHAGGNSPGPRPRSQRQLRVGEELRHALAQLLRPGELRDPALRDANITVTEVRVSPDLKNATAYVMPLAGANADEIMSGLKRSAPYLKTMIARTVELRQAPNIAFAYDTAFDSAARIAELLHAPEVERDLGPPRPVFREMTLR